MNTLSRRQFIRQSGAAIAGGLACTSLNNFSGTMTSPTPIRISDVNSNFEREPLTPYHFKGSAITEAWQAVSWLQPESGPGVVGLGTQSVLWSDSGVFAAHSESGGNALMYAMTERALQIIKGESFTDPISLLDELFPEVWAYGKIITRNPNLRKTFALNALVSVDNAAWLLYARENGMKTFDEMVPELYRPGLSHRHEKVASIPSFSVGANVESIKSAADQGYFLLKLKLGSSGTQQQMLEKDMEFISAVHKAIGHYETPYTSNGKIPYYFDANGRYEKKETLLRLLDHAKEAGAFDQIAVVEEPFREENDAYVGDAGVRIAADESAHTVEDAAVRIDQGYSVMAVKAIAKTLSMTMKIAKLAHEKNVPCFCADLTVNPILLEWNKCVAARLTPLPGMSTGLQEANGHQYYKNWNTMMTYHPSADSSWVKPRDGVFVTDNSFYEQSGGIFLPSEHYQKMFDDH